MKNLSNRFLNLGIAALIIASSIFYLTNCSRKKSPEEDIKIQDIPDVPRENLDQVREPAVSGSFYPDDLKELDAMIESFLKKAVEDPRRVKVDTPIHLILVPHAGYVFSGRTAAYAYAEIMGEPYDTVVLIGPPHRVAVTGASVYCGKGFRIPFGVIPVDTALAKAIVRSSDIVNDDEHPHIPEHSLEVQLPFLHKVLGTFSIVPILVMGEEKTLDRVAAAILEGIKETHTPEKRILFVISTDLSHFPNSNDALKCDSEIVKAFMTLDTGNLLKTNDEIMKWGIPNLACAMCGLDATYVGIKIANAIGADNAVLLHMSTSSDAGIPGASEERVVGYASVAVTSAHTTPGIRETSTFEPLMKEEQEFLLAVARKSLEEYLNHGSLPAIDLPQEYSDHLNEKRGVFVSIYNDSQLRGCIGFHVSKLPLYKAVQEMAVRSGFYDPRFLPLQPNELKGIRIELSVHLTSIVPIHSLDEFMVGRDGIILQKEEISATFLPHVATQQGWNKEQTLTHLCVKAGIAPDAWKDQDVKLFVYRTQIFKENGYQKFEDVM